MADLNQIRRAEFDKDYWKEQSLYYWKRYLRNKFIIHNLRQQNRRLRQIIQELEENN